MDNEIKIGDLVICDKDNWNRKPNIIYPQRGQILTVRTICEHLSPENKPCLYLRFEEITNVSNNDGKEVNFNIDGFRKVKTPCIQVFHDILKDWQNKIGEF